MLSPGCAIVCPMGFEKPIVFTAVSFRTTARESLGYLLMSISLPAINCRPAVFTKSTSALNKPIVSSEFGFLPGHLRAQVLAPFLVIVVIVLVIEEAIPELIKSCLIKE